MELFFTLMCLWSSIGTDNHLITTRQVELFLTSMCSRLYVQVTFELIYVSEISYPKIHLHEKAREDASFDMALKQEIKKAMVRHEKDAHLNNKKKKMIKKTT